MERKFWLCCAMKPPNRLQAKRLFLTGVESVDGATDAGEVGHLLEVQGNRAHLDGALFRDFRNDLFLREGALLLQDAFDDVRHRARLVAPFLEGVEASADEDELRIADELVMDGLD